MRKAAIGLLVFCLLLVVSATKSRAALPVTLEDIKKVLPKAHSHTHKIEPLDCHIVKDRDGKTIGIAFVTSNIPPEVNGYVDEIDVLVGMDLKGVVTGVVILSHRDTPQYIDRIVSGGFLKRFVGRSQSAGFDEIEAITGATISSDAIKRDIQTAIFEVEKKLLQSGAIKKGGLNNSSPFDVLSTVAVILLLTGVIAVTIMSKRRWLRYVVWGGSIVIAGFWLNTPITIGTIVDIRNGMIPAYLPLLIIFIFALIAALLKGNLYCAYVCPFGAIQEFAHRAKLPKCKPSAKAHRNASWLRWVVLILTVFAIVSAVDAFRTVEPFALCFARTFQPLVWIQAGVILVAALFLTRPWCRYFCPTGAVLDLIAQLSRKVRRQVHGWRGR
jgi:Na+-translocating ferredoxin:NAD+ oxidoreductase RnfG subunit